MKWNYISKGVSKEAFFASAWNLLAWREVALALVDFRHVDKCFTLQEGDATS